ncbi:MAG: TRAP transporter permease [Nitrospinota bacterium]
MNSLRADQFKNYSAKLAFVLGVAIAIFHLYANIYGGVSSLTQNGLHYAGFALLCSLLHPFGKSKRFATSYSVFFFNIALGLITVIAAVYMIFAEDFIFGRGVQFIWLDSVFAVILIISAMEYTRRTTGIVIPILIFTTLSYVGWWGSTIDGVFRFPGLQTETILFRSIFSDDALFGNIATISSTFVFMFILFGAFLLRSGGSEFIINVSRLVAGRLIGGPGLVSVVASSLTGTISGSAIANTASTGVITIPLMKQAGFSPKFAAAVEAAASTGGQLMPPIMGAGAFVMASYTGIPYTTIVAVSIIPAILYFLTVAFFVRIEAKKRNIGLIELETPPASEILKNGGLTFIVPVVVLTSLLIYGFTPTYAAAIGVMSVIIASWFTPNKMKFKDILETFALGANNMVTTGLLLCSIGLVVNVISMAGIGNTFSLMIAAWSQESLIIALGLIAVASLILGMGLPVTASYIVLGTLSAPAIYTLIVNAELIEIFTTTILSVDTKAILSLVSPDIITNATGPLTLEAATELLAITPPELLESLRNSLLGPEVLLSALLAAHLIIFWLSQDSNITPPVCLTAFTAAVIAKSPPMATGIESWKVAKGLYIVPILFAYTPLIGGTPTEVTSVFIFSIFGLYAFSATIQGHMENILKIPARIATFISAILLLWPFDIQLHIAGMVLLIAIFLLNIRTKPAVTGSTPIS